MKSLVPASLLALDALCIAASIAGLPAPDDAGALLALHGLLAAAYGAAVLVATQSPAFGALSALLAAFVPVAGPAGLLVAYSAFPPRPPEASGVEVLDPDGPVDDTGRPAPPRPDRREPGATSLRETLRVRTEGSAQRRFRALLDLGALPARRGVALLKLALTDPDDEVRLFAFSRLERWRSDIERSIESLASALPRLDRPRAACARLAMAQLHWETAYLGLVEGAVREHALRRALEHADAANVPPREAASRDFLRGRIYLQLHDACAARLAFEAAASRDYPRFRVLPYLAECAFLERDFDGVRSAMRELGRRPSMPVALGPVSELWS